MQRPDLPPVQRDSPEAAHQGRHQASVAGPLGDHRGRAPPAREAPRTTADSLLQDSRSPTRTRRDSSPGRARSKERSPSSCSLPGPDTVVGHIQRRTRSRFSHFGCSPGDPLPAVHRGSHHQVLPRLPERAPQSTISVQRGRRTSLTTVLTDRGRFDQVCQGVQLAPGIRRLTFPSSAAQI